MAGAAQKIAICDDDPAIRQMLADYLGEHHYSTSLCATAAELEALVAGDKPPDLALLDIRMPQKDGLSCLQTIRSISDMPVIMLTSAGEIFDKVLGLEFGADDYLVKPVDLRELLARVKAALRRQSTVLHPQSPIPVELVNVGASTLDTRSGILTSADGQSTILTRTELSLLCLFIDNKGKVLTRDFILQNAEGRDWEPFDRSIDLRISRIRRKLGPNLTGPDVIRTVRGMGYILD